ncbi:MAG: hypothetical protein ABSH33_22850, partial [Steroidobacteraceae bacterium]
EVRAHMTAWRLDGRPAAPRRLASVPALAPATAAAAATGTTASAATAPSAAPAAATTSGAADQDALKGRVHSLEQALDDMHKQLASETATIQDLQQLADHAKAATPEAAAPVHAAAPVLPAATVHDSQPAPVPSAASAPAALAPAAAPASSVAVAPAAAAAAHPSVRVEVMHADDPSAGASANIAPPASRMSSASFLGPIGFVLALALAGFAYSRRRVLKALEKPPAGPLIGAGIGDLATMAAPPIPQAAREIDAPRTSRAAEPSKPVAQDVRPEPAEAVAEQTAHKVPSDQTTQELSIDAELLERSYLDALAIDSLGIDTADTARNAAAAGESTEARESTDDTVTHEEAGLDTVALDASELDTAVDKADLHTAIMDTRGLEPVAAVGASLDYNLLDLDATSEHVQAQHVQMPSQLSDNVVVSERRMNIVDVLKTAIDRDPHRRDLRMKLVETYFSAASMNRRAFLEVVKKLSRERELLSADDWKQIVKMGKEIAPDDILFADPSAGDLADCA